MGGSPRYHESMDIELIGFDEKEEKQPLTTEELTLLDTTTVTEEDAAKFPNEFILEPYKEFTPEQRQNLSKYVIKMSIPEKIRLAILGNQEARNILIHDPNKVIPLAVLRNPKVSENEALLYAQLRTLPDDVLVAISKHKVWIKNYPIKLALISNPKTPLPLAIKLLDHLHDRDLQNLARSKAISYVLARSAARLHFKRRG